MANTGTGLIRHKAKALGVPVYELFGGKDGSTPATEWNGVLSIDETPGLKNPPNGISRSMPPFTAAEALPPRAGV